MEISYDGLLKVISGGQTGADEAGLRAAVDAGIQTGGTAPANFMTEAGPNEQLRDLGLVAKGTLKTRTVQNIKDSCGTVIFSSNLGSPGTVLTINTCLREKKPYLAIDTNQEDSVIAQQVADWIQRAQIRVLNVAGNRLSKDPSIFDKTRRSLKAAFDLLVLRGLAVTS